MSRKVIITGSTGFVGSKLGPELTASGHKVHALDLRTFPTKLAKADLVIHLAAIAHRPDTDKDDSAYFRVNRDLALSVARAAAKSGVGHMIHFSTSKVSGGPHEDDPTTAEDAYSRSKAEAEAGLREIHEETGMHITCLRPPVIYGPGVKGNIRRLFEKVADRRPLPSGALHARRSVLGIDNLVSAVQTVMEHPDGFKAYHVADERPVSTAELVEFAAEAMGVKVRHVPVPKWTLRAVGLALGRRRDVERLLEDSILDTSRIQEGLDWHPPVPTRTGFQEAARAFLEARS